MTPAARYPVDQPASILATAVIPWTKAYTFDAARFRQQVALIARNLTSAIYVFGTAGEGHAVSDAQFREIAGIFLESARQHGATPMLGVISLSLPTIIERIVWGRDAGCRRFQLSLPSWGPLNDRELDAFFVETCGRFPDCAFHFYNVPRSKRVLAARDLRRIASRHPNLIALKSGAKDPAAVTDLLTLSPRLRLYFTEAGYAQARRTHDVGLLISLAALNPRRAHLFVTGSAEERESMLAELQSVGAALRQAIGDRCHIDSAFDKLLCRATLPDFPLRLLPPYAGATEEDFQHFLTALPSPWRPTVARDTGRPSL